MTNFMIMYDLLTNVTESEGYIPEQLNPFPSYPKLQEQLYDPFVFEQLALESQWWPVIHSSISAKKNDNCKVTHQ